MLTQSGKGAPQPARIGAVRRGRPPSHPHLAHVHDIWGDTACARHEGSGGSASSRASELLLVHQLHSMVTLRVLCTKHLQQRMRVACQAKALQHGKHRGGQYRQWPRASRLEASSGPCCQLKVEVQRYCTPSLSRVASGGEWSRETCQLRQQPTEASHAMRLPVRHAS